MQRRETHCALSFVFDAFFQRSSSFSILRLLRCVDLIGQIRCPKTSTLLKFAERQAHKLSRLSDDAKRIALPAFFSSMFAILVWPLFLALVSTIFGNPGDIPRATNRLSAFHATWKLGWHGLPQELPGTAHTESVDTQEAYAQHRRVWYHAPESSNTESDHVSYFHSRHETVCPNEVKLSYGQCTMPWHEDISISMRRQKHKQIHHDVCTNFRNSRLDPEKILRWNLSFDLDLDVPVSQEEACSRARLAAEIQRFKSMTLEDRMGLIWAALFEWGFPAADGIVLPIFLVSGGWWSLWSFVTTVHGLFLNPFCFLSVAIMSVVSVYFTRFDTYYVSTLKTLTAKISEIRIHQARRENVMVARVGVALCGCAELELGAILPDDIIDVVFEFLNGDPHTKSSILPMYCVDESISHPKDQARSRRTFLRYLYHMHRRRRSKTQRLS